MSEKKFTKEQIEYLSKNQYVKHVSEKGITYTAEFKEYFIKEYEKGFLPTKIFESAGLPKSILGRDRIASSTSRFKQYSNRVEGFSDTRVGNSGRPITRNLTIEEKLKIAEDKIKYLQQENEFLKKIRSVERKVKKKSQ